MDNIRQITNYDLADAPTVMKNIEVAGKILNNYPYKVITTDKLKRETFKMGYCCEPRGIGFPIFLKFQAGGSITDNEQEFEIGKTGMFEFQPEDYNATSETIETASVLCYQVAVPADIEFTLDYVYSAN